MYMNDIEQRIADSDHGQLFIYSDFADTAPNAAVRKAFSRLEDQGVLRRVTRGIYDKPRYIKRINEYAAPDPDKVAYKLAEKFGWSIVPSGATALNLLGLSTQVPNVFEYASDGPYRSYDIGSYQLRFTHTANRELSGLSPISATVIQAIRALGEDNTSSADIEHLAKRLTEQDRALLLSEGKRSAVWVYDVIKEICSR
jgi:predicted transcriptional regulator of viral defense system